VERFSEEPRDSSRDSQRRKRRASEAGLGKPEESSVHKKVKRGHSVESGNGKRKATEAELGEPEEPREYKKRAAGASSPEKGTRKNIDDISDSIVDKSEKILGIISPRLAVVPNEDVRELYKLIAIHNHLIKLPPSETNVDQLEMYKRRIGQWHDYFHKTYEEGKKGIEKPEFLPFEVKDYILPTILNMNKEIIDILKREHLEEANKKLSEISSLVLKALNAKNTSLLDQYCDRIAEWYDYVHKKYMNGEEGIRQPESIYEESSTQTPRYDFQELLPKDSERARRFFAVLQWPKPVEQAPAIIVVTHLFAADIPFLYAVKERGPLKMVIAKTVSRDPDVIRHFQYHNLHQKLGKRILHPNDMNDENKTFPIVDFGREVTEEPEDIAERIRRVLDPGQSVIILDHGAYFKKINEIQASLGDDHRIIGICETTLNGVLEYRKQERDGLLSKPVISISNEIKKADDVMIGDSIVASIRRILSPYNVNIRDQKALVIGYGAVGEAIAGNLRTEKVTIYDIANERQMHAKQHYTTITTDNERDGALEQSEIIYCATGNLALRATDYLKLRNGCFIVLGTSADIEIAAVPKDQYEYRPNRDNPNLHEYRSKTEDHYFYILGPKLDEYIGAANFTDLQPTSGSNINNVLGMAVAAIPQMYDNMFEEQKPGVQELRKENQRIVANIWMNYYNSDKLDPEEILRQRHRRTDIDGSTFKEISAELKLSRELEKKYGSNRPTPSLPILEPLRRSYAEGKIDTTTFKEILSKLEDSIKREQVFRGEDPDLGTSALGVLREKYATRGDIKTKEFEERLKQLEASIAKEQSLRSKGRSVDTSVLEALRRDYEQEKIDLATFKEMEPRLKASIKREEDFHTEVSYLDTSALRVLQERYASGAIKTEDFKAMLERLERSIVREQVLRKRSKKTLVDTSVLGGLRHDYEQEKIDATTFDDMRSRLEGSIKREQDFHTEVSYLDTSVLRVLQERYASGAIGTEEFEKRLENLDSSIVAEQAVLRNKKTSVDTGVLAVLRNRYVQGKIDATTFDEMRPWLELSIKKEQDFYRRDLSEDTTVLAVLGILRERYASGVIGTEEFEEKLEKLEGSIKNERDFHRRDLSVDTETEALAVLRGRYAQGEIDTATFDEAQSRQEVNMNMAEQTFSSENPFVNTGTLAVLRNRYAQGKIDTATFNKVQSELKASITIEKTFRREDPFVNTGTLESLRNRYAQGKIDTATFNKVQSGLKASITIEKTIHREDPSVDTGVLRSLREDYSNNVVDINEFKTMHEQLETAFKDDTDYRNEQALSVTLNIQQLMLKQYTKGDITADSLYKVLKELHNTFEEYRIQGSRS